MSIVSDFEIADNICPIISVLILPILLIFLDNFNIPDILHP